MIKVILISQFELPASKIGSWTTLYKNYLENNHKIDYIVCPKPNKLFEGIKYSFVNLTFLQKLERKLLKRKNREYLKALDKLIIPDQKYIFQIVDNYGMVKSLKNYLNSKGHKHSYIQFFYHGFLPYSQQNAIQNFYDHVDEIILLTNDSYKQHLKQIANLPNSLSILHNGIDTDKFTKVSDSDKIKLKKELGFNNKKVFIWCSQDRPKKGLNLILDAWRKVYKSQRNIILIVIGSEKKENIEGVKFLGKIPNNELPKYYQASDCYLFPTLYQEGFGLSLIEALHCGNFCIASALGGVPEVLKYGEFGKLIENPHFVSDWVAAIEDFLQEKFENPVVPSDLYSMKIWNEKMNIIIGNAKSKLEVI